MMKYDQMLKFLRKIMKKAGKIILNASDELVIDNKNNAKDMVTQYDTKVQRLIVSALKKKYPEILIVGEEDGLGENIDVYKNNVFIIDPIDGTNNFVYGMRHSAVSIAYAEKGDVKVGAVYNPYKNEFFSAISGKGAYRNGKRIFVNKLPLQKGFVGFGTAVYYDEVIEPTTRAFTAVLSACTDMRRCGTASLDLCGVASGSYCAFFEYRLAPYDYGAGSLIIKEAGGVIYGFDKKDLPLNRKGSVLAGNKEACESLYEIIKKVNGDKIF